jgi:hypothetical protein
MAVDGLDALASAVAVATRDRCPGVDQFRGQLSLDPCIAFGDVAGVDGGSLVQRIQRLIERSSIERRMTELADVLHLDVEDAPVLHRGTADLVVVQVDVVGLAGDVDEPRLLELPEQLRGRQVDSGFAADRVAARIQQDSTEDVGIGERHDLCGA